MSKRIVGAVVGLSLVGLIAATSSATIPTTTPVLPLDQLRQNPDSYVLVALDSDGDGAPDDRDDDKVPDNWTRINIMWLLKCGGAVLVCPAAGFAAFVCLAPAIWDCVETFPR